MQSLIKVIKITVFFALFASIAFFSAKNYESVSIDLSPLVSEFNIPKFLYAIIMSLFGALFASAFFLIDQIKKNFEIKRLRRELQSLQKQENSTKNEPTLQASPSPKPEDKAIVESKPVENQ